MMRHPLSVHDRHKVELALLSIGAAIKNEYPEADDPDDRGEPDYRWGLGEGFAMALRGVVDAALPGWSAR